MRTFDTHKIRKIRELTGKLWEFTPLEGVHKGEQSKVMVPGSIETYPGYENFKGKAEYRTEFEGEGNIRIICEGVSHFAQVYVDGSCLMEHYGSYTPFAGCVRGLQPGTHSLVIIADNSMKEEYSLDFPNDYMSYGGITRDVVVENIPEIYLSCIHVTPLKETEEGWQTKVEVFCGNIADEEKEADIRGNIAGTEFYVKNVKVPQGENQVLSVEMMIPGVKAWSMEEPLLYTAVAELMKDGKAVDDLIERVGFRTVKVEGKRILLNGKPVRIKGFCRHEDHPMYGCALPKAAIAYDLQRIMDMGANSVRTSHYPNDQAFLDMCDELGILVWEEGHARGMSEEQMRNPLFESQSEAVIREMIKAHYNHPSILSGGF